MFAPAFLVGCEEEDVHSVAVSAYAPTKSAAASTVIIYGKNFSTDPTDNVVKINGTEAIVSIATPDVLHITVPVTATSGELTVTTGGKTVTAGNLEIVQAEGSWHQKATFPGLWRYSPASFSYNGYGYIGLGWDDQQFTDLWKYDPAADEWRQLNDASFNSEDGPFTVVSTFVTNGVAYMLCFAFEADKMFMCSYDIEQDEWEFIGSDVPQPVYLFTMLPQHLITSHAYAGQGIIGYFTLNESTEYSLPIYDIQTKAWSFSAMIPGQPWYLWIQDSKAFSLTPSALHEYTFATDTWQERPFNNFPTIVNSHPDPVVLNESIYFAMGSTGYALLGDVWKYTPATDVWVPVKPCPSITGEPSFFTINNKAYFVLGQATSELNSPIDKNLTMMMLTP